MSTWYLCSYNHMALQKFNPLSLSFLTATFPGEPGWAGFLELGTMKVAVRTGVIRRAKLQSDHHHQQTNIKLYTGRMSFLSPNQQHRQHVDNILCNISMICPPKMSISFSPAAATDVRNFCHAISWNSLLLNAGTTLSGSLSEYREPSAELQTQRK